MERNGRAWISDRTRPSGPEPRPTWSLTTFPSSEPLYPWQAWHYEAIGVMDAWKLTTGDPGIIVAVVDDGIRFDHPDIADNLAADGYDFVSDQQVNRCSGGLISASGDGDGPDPDPTIPSTYHWDDSLDCAVGPAAIGAHGLHVAGTIAALGQNDYGGVGVAPDVQIRPVRVIGVPGFGSNYDIAQGILYAAGLPADNGMGGVVQPSSGSHVINLSLGGPGDTQVLRSAVSAADAAGSLVVASAGNDDSFTPSFPAAYPQAIAVAAVGPTLGRAPYSSMGSHVEIAAPGGNLAGHDESWGVISTRWDFSSNGPAFQAIQGTSMASPHVSGVAALLFAQDPSLSNAQVRSRLTQHAVDLGAPGRDPQFGFGLVDAISALTDGQGIPGDSHVRLYDADRGSLVDEQTQGPSGSFRFAGLEDGDYLVFAGLDESFDGLVGAPPRPWGALGGSARPMTMVIRGAGTRDGSFSFGQPIEGEPNDAFGSSNRLVFPSYLNADLASGLDEDVYEIRIPNGGTYAFETTGNLGACGFALGGDTVLELLDQSGTVLAENDDIDVDRQNYCSRILQSLAPGQYFLRVSAFNSDRAGRYRILAREGG